MERSRLAQLRAKKHWSLQHAAVLLEVDITTLNRWEHGKASPRQYNIEKLCEVYGCSEGELGLLHEMSTVEVPVAPPLFDITNESQSFLANDLTMRLLPLAFVPLSYQNTQREVTKLLEEHTMNSDPITRREAVRRLATLPIAMLKLNALTPTLGHPPEAVLTQCTTGIIACWHLRKGKELHLASSAVSAYIPTLKEIVTTSTQHRKNAADLLVQCYLLKSTLMRHVESSNDAIACARLAETYSEVAEDPVLQVLSIRTLASTHYYANHWGPALRAAEKAEYVQGKAKGIPPIVKSYVYAGLATYQAQHGQREALTSLKHAHTAFFAQTVDNDTPIWIDHNLANLLLNDGTTHFHLGMFKKALDSFDQVKSTPTRSTLIGVEAVISQVLAEVSRDDEPRDMDFCIILWQQGMKEALALQSEQRFIEAVQAYTAMRAAWPGEARINALREGIAHW